MLRRLLSVTHVTYEWSAAGSPLGCSLVQPRGRSGYSGLGNRPPGQPPPSHVNVTHVISMPTFIRYCCVAYREPVLSATAARTETARISQNEALILQDWRPTEIVLGLQLRRISILCET